MLQSTSGLGKHVWTVTDVKNEHICNVLNIKKKSIKINLISPCHIFVGLENPRSFLTLVDFPTIGRKISGFFFLNKISHFPNNLKKKFF